MSPNGFLKLLYLYLEFIWKKKKRHTINDTFKKVEQTKVFTFFFVFLKNWFHGSRSKKSRNHGIPTKIRNCMIFKNENSTFVWQKCFMFKIHTYFSILLLSWTKPLSWVYASFHFSSDYLTKFWFDLMILTKSFSHCWPGAHLNYKWRVFSLGLKSI